MMLPRKPYIVKMLYQWIIDSGCTPYIGVNTSIDFVDVPQEYVKNYQIILNVAPVSVSDLIIDNQYISFFADFAGEERFIYVPMLAITAIYAKENGEGTMFDDEDADHPLMEPIAPPALQQAAPSAPENKVSHLKIIK